MNVPVAGKLIPEVCGRDRLPARVTGVRSLDVTGRDMPVNTGGYTAAHALADALGDRVVGRLEWRRLSHCGGEYEGYVTMRTAANPPAFPIGHPPPANA